MNQRVALQFSIESKQTSEFARLSGDFNPLHLDPVVARRTQFGGVVAHGMHVLLRALDGIAAYGLFEHLQPQSLSVTFSNPVAVDALVRLDGDYDADLQRVRITAKSQNRSAATIVLRLHEPAVAKKAELEDRAFEVEAPHDQSFPPECVTGEVTLSLDSQRFGDLFPGLAASSVDRRWIADLLAATRIVGMRCPGAHSIFSACKFAHRADSDEALSRSMSYRVSRADERFKMILLSVVGARLEGTIETLFRPAPVKQTLSAERLVGLSPKQFLGQRILVVGGSRGLGEVTAKFIAAGGGDVTITYASGEADAASVCAESERAVGACQYRHLDMAVAQSGEPPEWLSQHYSHVYYFASPHISRNATGEWDRAQFERFSRIYIHGFAWLVEILSGSGSETGRTKFLYPSTVFLDDARELGFAEYCAAKLAGESLCDHLARQHKVSIVRPRLPKMLTDQTIGTRDGSAADPFTVMAAIILDMQR